MSVSCWKLFSGSYCPHTKPTFLSSAYRALCDLPLLTLQAYLLTLFLTFCGSRGGEELVMPSQPRGLAISCTSVKPCLNGILSRKPFSTSFPKWPLVRAARCVRLGLQFYSFDGTDKATSHCLFNCPVSSVEHREWPAGSIGSGP